MKLDRRSFLVGCAGLAAGCTHSSTPRAYDIVKSTSDPIADRFNAARSKVRVLMLVSPT